MLTKLMKPFVHRRGQSWPSIHTLSVSGTMQFNAVEQLTVTGTLNGSSISLTGAAFNEPIPPGLPTSLPPFDFVLRGLGVTVTLTATPEAG